jgi:GTP-dependent phosphoenolpyruvate carboxykinase
MFLSGGGPQMLKNGFSQNKCCNHMLLKYMRFSKGFCVNEEKTTPKITFLFEFKVRAYLQHLPEKTGDKMRLLRWGGGG